MSPDWAAKWSQDLTTLIDTLPKIHPNPFHRTRVDAFRAAVEALRRSLPGFDHERAPVELERIMALVGDGHTRLTLPVDTAAGFFTGHARTSVPRVPGLVFRHFPLRLASLADGLFVDRASPAYRELLGATVVAIDGKPVAEVIDAVRPTIHGDNDSQVAGLIPTWLVLPGVLRATGVIGAPDRATWTFVVAGRRVERVISAAAVGERIGWIDRGSPPLRDRSPEKNQWTELLPGRWLYARLRNVVEDSDGSIARFAEEIGARVARGEAERLILDLRDNPGGDAFLAAPVLRTLVRETALWEPGRMMVLIDRGSFSAAVNLAGAIEMHTPAIMVGEKSGGHPNSYGDARRIVLPETGLTVRSSTLFWQITGPGDRRDGITPLLPAPIAAAEWRAGRDPALDAALSLGGRDPIAAGRWVGTLAARYERLPFGIAIAQREGRWVASRVGDRRPDVPLDNVRVTGSRIEFEWGASEGRWRAEAHRAGTRMVGVARYKGSTFPFLLAASP
jgi:hypothetical protein